MNSVPTVPWVLADEQPAVVEKLLKLGLIKFDPNGQLPLKSGGKTDIYINLRDARSHPGVSTLIAHLYSRPLRFLDIDRFLEVPHSVSGFASILSEKTGIPYVTVRDQEKVGRVGNARIIGHPVEGENVVTIDDVITTGASKVASHQVCQQYGLNHRAIVVLVDRQQGWQEDFQQLGIDVPVWAGMTLQHVREHLTRILGVTKDDATNQEED